MVQHRNILLHAGVMLLLLVAVTGCRKAEDIKSGGAKPEKVLLGFTGGNNTQNRLAVVHLYSDTVYLLTEQFVREAGEQLVIDAGTLIKVAVGGAPVGISIRPGGVIIANGTATDPIVFTANAPTGTQQRTWAGVDITGNSTDNSVTGQQPDITHFSGSLKYVRIEFAGLILNKLGSSSLIENVQVSYAGPQSSFEINGGTFNARYLVSYACTGPVDFYINRGYTGKMQYLLAYRHPFFGSAGFNPSNALAGVFIENNPFNPIDARPYTFPSISNLTVLGPNRQNGSVSLYNDTTFRTAALITTGSTGFHIRNSILMGFPGSSFYIDEYWTAYGLDNLYSDFMHSIVQSSYGYRTFYLLPGAYPPFLSVDFNEYMSESRFSNEIYDNASAFGWQDPFNYLEPDLMAAAGSPVLDSADFTGAVFSDPFFEKVSFRGAVGETDWLKGWTNFVPLKTNYNIPQ
jgi:hypothetical protein